MSSSDGCFPGLVVMAMGEIVEAAAPPELSDVRDERTGN
jgi:hypothetical protein